MLGGVPTGHPGADVRAAGETDVYADRARRLGLPFAPVVHLGQAGPADIAAIRHGTFAIAADGDHLAYFAPEETMLPLVGRWLRKFPEMRNRLRVATPAAIRAALVRSAAAHLADDAVDRLAARHPQHSARVVVTSPQAIGALLLCLLAAAGIYFDTIGTLVAIDLIGGMLFFGVSALRFVAAGFVDRRPLAAAAPTVSERDLPVYTILLPLYGEANVVADLIASVGALDWPQDRLDVKLLIEADDRATIAAAERAIPGPPFEIVIVPPLGPRTKPKALAFALPLARGDFITVYDAEDRPHPQQLRQAYATFARSGPDLACLQSALVIDNGDDNWLTLLFAIEYAALFDGLLPALAALGMPLPLGGTSNHFRRIVLEKVGGWDPFNVTEDADIGFRLARFGYRSATIDLPTMEDAPISIGPWFRQRSRWFKGWMQTWLVHTRHPQLANSDSSARSASDSSARA